MLLVVEALADRTSVLLAAPWATPAFFSALHEDVCRYSRPETSGGQFPTPGTQVSAWRIVSTSVPSFFASGDTQAEPVCRTSLASTAMPSRLLRCELFQVLKAWQGF